VWSTKGHSEMVGGISGQVHPVVPKTPVVTLVVANKPVV
jgi:hypothetical protein